ncbi:hypothetical protein Pst134EB_006051 [Puccinia striiformis f. sp. tritici]|nr:hypothetical protein Pst134EB_006051 [Puccinia striiformis f. sp. tritici]
MNRKGNIRSPSDPTRYTFIQAAISSWFFILNDNVDQVFVFILNKEAYHSTDTTQFGSGDVSGVSLKLNQGTEDITKRIRSQVTTHDINLLKKASSATSSKQPLQSDKNALLQLESSLQRLHRKTGNHHSTLEDALNRLDRYPAAAELSRRTSQFVTLAKQTTRSSDGRTR